MTSEARGLEASCSSSPIAELLRVCSVIVVVGAGGVGKTTTAAALGVAAAVAGRRVLCLTIDPARRLAQALGLNAMSSEEQEVVPELFAQAGVELSGRLTVMMLDARAAFDRIVLKHSSSPERARRVMDNRLYQHVSNTLSGTQDYMAMETLVAVKADPRFDLIVLDTPPTANALDFLDAPRRLTEALDSTTVRWLAERVRKTERLSLDVFARSAALVVHALARITGARFLDSMGELILDLSELFAGFKERASRVEAALRADDVSFVMVTSPAPASISEVLFLGDRLAAAELVRGALVVNRFRTPVPRSVAVATEEDAARALSRYELRFEDDAGARLIRAHGDAMQLAAMDQKHLLRLEGPAIAGVPIIRIPERDGDIQNVRALFELAMVLRGGGLS
jgi:anion-transporting  ArsA/GET3 family ATPase